MADIETPEGKKRTGLSNWVLILLTIVAALLAWWYLKMTP